MLGIASDLMAADWRDPPRPADLADHLADPALLRAGRDDDRGRGPGGQIRPETDDLAAFLAAAGPQGRGPGADQGVDQVLAVLVSDIAGRGRFAGELPGDPVGGQQQRRVGGGEPAEPADQGVTGPGTVHPRLLQHHPPSRIPADAMAPSSTDPTRMICSNVARHGPRIRKQLGPVVLPVRCS
jgi:hypothetical protein